MKHLVATTLLFTCVAVTQVAVAQEPTPGGPPSSSATPDRTTDPAASAPPAASTPDSPAPTPDAPVNAPTPPPVVSTPPATVVAVPTSPVNAVDLATAYQIGPEDVLDISVWKNPELSRTVPVRPDGKVSLPLVNDIQAAGLTPLNLRDQVTAKLSEYIPAPEVSVIVREVHSRKVTVTGNVKTPGRYDLKSAMTVLEVIALAQGFNDFASRDKIVVIRQKGQTQERIPFNYRKIADSAGQDNFLVRPGDIILVP